MGVSGPPINFYAYSQEVAPGLEKLAHSSSRCSRKWLTGLEKLVQQTGEHDGISLLGLELEECRRDQVLLLQSACLFPWFREMRYHARLRNSWTDEFEFQTWLLQSRRNKLNWGKQCISRCYKLSIHYTARMLF
jgi:hypothetical protein